MGREMLRPIGKTELESGYSPQILPLISPFSGERLRDRIFISKTRG